MPGRGYLPDPADHRVTDVHHLFGAPGATPAKSSLESSIPGVFNQAASNSCTGWATAGSIATRFTVKGEPLPAFPSPQGIYALGRCIDRVPDARGHLAPLTDDGAMPSQVMRGITEWGIASSPSWPFNQATINDEPNLLELEALDVRLEGQYRINATGALRVAKIRQAIAAGYPVTFGVMVDPAFEDWDGKGVIGAPDARRVLGGHYLYAVAYETTRAGRTVFRFVNSWTRDWGDDGLGLGDEDFIAGASDIDVMNVTRKAA